MEASYMEARVYFVCSFHYREFASGRNVSEVINKWNFGMNGFKKTFVTLVILIKVKQWEKMETSEYRKDFYRLAVLFPLDTR